MAGSHSKWELENVFPRAGQLTPTADQLLIQKTSKRAELMLPMGTYKGYGLGLAIDMLCGALTMSGGCNRIPLDGANGVFALVIKSDIFVPKDEFASSVEDIVQFVLDCPLQKGFRQILLPGQPEVISLEERTKHGIPIHEVLWAKLKSLAVENGVPLPSQ